VGDVTSEPVGPSVAEGASVLDVGKVESVALGIVVDPSVGTDVATCGSWRDGPPGAVVETARVVTGAVVDEPPAVVVVDGSPVTVVDAPSAIVVLEVSIGEIG
jgi:hypothetical protein